MFTTAQCQKPVTVGASGSHIVTTKLCVPAGKPLQESCGETSLPPAPKMPLTCGIASFSPSRKSLLVSEKEAAAGRCSYGFQVICVLLLSVVEGSSDGSDPPHGLDDDARNGCGCLIRQEEHRAGDGHQRCVLARLERSALFV